MFAGVVYWQQNKKRRRPKGRKNVTPQLYGVRLRKTGTTSS
jgi:hypothetical protein